MPRSTSAAVLLAALLATGTSVVGGAVAEVGVDEQPDAALAEDAVLAGVDPGSAGHGRDVADTVGVLQTELALQYRDTFAGARLNEAGVAPTFRFVGEPPPGALGRLDAAGIAYQLDTSADASLARLRQIQHVAHEALAAAGFESVATGIDEFGSRVRVRVGPATVEEVLEVLQTALPDVPRSRYDLSVSDESVVELQQGGA